MIIVTDVSLTKHCLIFSFKSLHMDSGYARHDSEGRGSDNVHNDHADAEAFRDAYRTHFSDSFHKIFTEVLLGLYLISSLGIYYHFMSGFLVSDTFGSSGIRSSSAQTLFKGLLNID